MSFLLTQHNGPSPLIHTPEKTLNKTLPYRLHMQCVTPRLTSVSVSVIFIVIVYGFRAQAPCCAACRAPILPTEVSYKPTEMTVFLDLFVLFDWPVNGKQEKDSMKWFCRFVLGGMFVTVSHLFVNTCRGQQSPFEWYHSTEITMWSATAVRLTSFKENNRLTFIFLFFSAGLWSINVCLFQKHFAQFLIFNKIITNNLMSK